MRAGSKILSIGLMVMLTACGGKTLSFKNSDELIKTYKSATADLTEAERLEFRRNMFLVAWTADTSEAEVSLSHIQTAWSHERNMHDILGPDGAIVAKELALKGVSKLDGKTVAQVNELGANLTSLVTDTEVQSVEEKIATLDAAIKQLNADKQTWKDRKVEAVAAEAALVAETQKYEPTVSSKKMNKSWGTSLTGQVGLTSPYSDPIYDFRYNLTVEHDGYRAFYRDVRGQFSRYKKTAPFNLSLSPQSFFNEAGDSPPRGYDWPAEDSRYDINFRPIWVRTSGTKNGYMEYEYTLDSDLVKALFNLPTALKSCDQVIETAQKFRTAYETRIEQLRAEKFDDLNLIYGQFAESCL